MPWWNADCEKHVKAAKHSFYVFRKHLIEDNRLNYKKSRAKARKTIKSSKTNTWKNDIKSFNPLVPVNQVWKSKKRIQGSNSIYFTSVLINEENQTIGSIPDMANLLAKTFTYNSSSNIYTDEFIPFKKRIERERESSITIPGEKNTNNERNQLNEEFTSDELMTALLTCKYNSPGLDRVPLAFIKQMSYKFKQLLFKIYNNIWISNSFPEIWKSSNVIDLLKPNKDKSSPIKYRPIAFICTVGKLMEKMVNYRLKWFLETLNIISSY